MKAVATLAAAAGLVAVGVLSANHSSSAALEGSLYEQQEFLKYVARFGRSYQSASEMKSRFSIFKSNLDYINNENTKGNGYTLAVNQFADWTKDEFKAIAGAKVPQGLQIPAKDARSVSDLNASPIDWRTRKNSNGDAIMPTVQNQKQCGSCYSFAASGALSCAAMIKGCWSTAYHISEQWVVDCDQYDNGCNGGWEMNVWYWGNSHGCVLESDYAAYTASVGTCTASNVSKKWFMNGLSMSYASAGASGFLTAIANHPLAIAIDCQCENFMWYKSGLLDDKAGDCQGQIDHAVMLVGWAEAATCTGGKYAILRNSWGTSWGEEGYARVCFGNWEYGNLMMFQYMMQVEVKTC